MISKRTAGKMSQLIFIALVFFCAACGSPRAEIYDQSQRGIPEQEMLRGDDIYTDMLNLSMESQTPAGILTGGKIGLRYTFTFTTREVVHIFPISVRVADRVRVRLLFPSVTRWREDSTGSEVASRGFGDMSMNLRLRLGSAKRVAIVPNLYVKVPSGSTTAFGGKVPLGTGSFDYILGLMLGHRVGSFDFMAGAAFRLNGNDNLQVNHNNVKTHVGHSWYYYATVEAAYAKRHVAMSLQASGVAITRGFSDSAGVRTSDLGRLVTCDLTPGIKYIPNASDRWVEFHIKAGIPVYTGFDPAWTNHTSRKMLYNIGMTLTF